MASLLQDSERSEERSDLELESEPEHLEFSNLDHLVTVGTQESDAQDQRQEPHEISAKEERMKKFRELRMRRNEAKKLNHQEVVEEDRKNKLPANFEVRRRKAEWEVQEEQFKKEAEEAGEDYKQLKLLDSSADELERLQRKRKKKNPDSGFSDYAQAQYRQYERLIKQINPDLESYEKKKCELGEEMYPRANSLGYGGIGEVSKEGLDRMTKDLDKQLEKRSKFSRRREFMHDADVDYINERNRGFNKKAARFYDKYTTEIKQNLERGTAI